MNSLIMDITNVVLLFFVLIVASYMAVLIYLNSKAKPNQTKLPEKHASLRTSVSLVSLAISGIFLLMLLLFSVGVIFFRDEFLPR